MEADNDKLPEQIDQSKAQSSSFQQPTIAAAPISYSQSSQGVDQPPRAAFSAHPPFPYHPGNFNPGSFLPGPNQFMQPGGSATGANMPADVPLGDNAKHALPRPPFYMPPFGMRPGMSSMPQHFSHPPPHMMPRTRTPLQPPSAFFQESSMFNSNFFPAMPEMPCTEQKINAPEKPEVWVETLTPEGKVYFYHSKTRESSWTKPSGSSKVVTQVEFEMMSQNPNLMNPHHEASHSGDNHQQHATRDASMQQHKPQDGDNLEAETEYLSGSPPQWTLTHEQKCNSLNSDVSENIPKMSVAALSTIPGASAANNSVAAPTGMQMMMMPPINIPFIDENLERVAREWTEHRNEYGRVYYYNSKSMESTWDVPPVLLEYREKQRLMLINGFAMVPRPAPPVQAANPIVEMTPEEELKLKMEAKAAEEERKKKRQLEASKPISTRPIPATPWCMVWTKDDRIFFHNPSTGASLWDCPLELLGRPDVEKWMNEDITSDAAKSETKKSEEPVAKKPKLNETETTSSIPLYFPNMQNSFAQSFPAGFPPGFPTPHGFNQPPEMNQQQPPQMNFFDANNAAFPATTNKKQNKQNPADGQAGEKSTSEERLQKFMELLAEKEVSAFSTWEKELPKLVFDPRYLLLPAKERKPAFEQYLRLRCDEERKEKLQKMKMKKDEFKKMMQDADMSGRWTFLDFCSKLGRDDRFRAVEKMKEREALFNEFITELRRREKMDTKTILEQAKKDFNQMLREKVPSALLVPGSYWQDARVYVQMDPRYRVVLDHPSHCEGWYKELCHTPYNVEGSDEGEYVEEVDEETRKARERQERVEASLREREKAVQESLYASLMERDKERKSHMREESVQHFKALMADMVKSADVSWRETRHNLRKDNRWSLVKHLDRAEKEQLFDEHVAAIAKKNKMAFHRLLDETLAGSLTTAWKDIRRKIRDDPRCSKFSSHEKKREKEFDEYMVQRRSKAKQEFKDLLRETRLINHRSAELASDSGQHLKDIIAILQKDKRFLILDSMPEERMEILTNYINEVAKRAPSPPPTACDPRGRAPPR